MAGERNQESAFLAALAPELRTAYAAWPGLVDELRRLVAEATATDPEQFVADVAARLPADVAPERALATVRAADLALATACSRVEPDALARCERELFGEVDAARARFRNVSLTADELRQAMRERLFVAQDRAAPRIASYQGRGDLRAWIRMATTRYLVDVVRAESARPDRPGGEERFADAATASDDPELAFLKRTYRAEFRAAFADALASLEARDRNVLRHRYLDGLEVNELATVYGVHRVSMSRTLGRIRADLLTAIRRELGRRLGSSELDSVMKLVSSQLELSLSRLLAP